MAVEATWDAADASGIHNVFRNLFDIPAGAITNPPLLSISFDASGNPVIHTPPLNPSATGFDISILASDTLTSTGGTPYPLDPTGSTTIPQNGKSTRFFRLQALPHIEVFVPIIEGEDIEVVVPINYGAAAGRGATCCARYIVRYGSPQLSPVHSRVSILLARGW